MMGDCFNCVGEKLGNPRKGIQEMVNRCNLKSTWPDTKSSKVDTTKIKGMKHTVAARLVCLANLLKFICHSERARTDFWIQNSRLFPCFFLNNNFFFQTQGYQIGD